MPGNLEGKEMKEREGCPVAGCVASACKSGHWGASDPVVRDTAEGPGPEGLPSGTGPAALCRRPPPTTADHALYFCAGPALIRGEGFTDSSEFWRLFEHLLEESKNECFLGGAHNGQHPRHHPHHPHPWRALMRMMPVMRGMLVMLSPKSGQFCRKRAT